MSSGCKIEVLDAVEVAELLRVSKQTVYAAAREGDLPCRRVGRRYVFVRSVIEDWLLMREPEDTEAKRPARSKK